MRGLVRTLVVVSILAGVLVSASPAAAQDADALRRELEQMRRQFEQVQQEYRKALETLAERLQRLEAKPQSAATQPAAPSQAQASQAPPGQPTLRELAQPRPPFSLAERGPGRLLFDIGLVADLVANLVQDNVDRANAGTFAGRENRFFPREIELNLFGQIDPYARGEVRIEVAEEFEAGQRVTEVGLAEAHLTLLTLPFGTQLKMGQMRNRFGLLNQLHREALPQTDQPNVLTRFFGEEGLVERGLELSWIAPLPFYLELLAGVFNGDNEDAFGRGSLKRPLATGRLRTFFELGDLGAIQLGASAASGQTEAKNRQTFAGVDAKYKLTPEGWRHPLLTLAGEGIWSDRQARTAQEPIEDREFGRFGWYTYAELQPWKQWLGGVRYDSTQLLRPEDRGREWAVEPYIAFMPSEFLRFRLGYKHTERDRREPFTFADSTARIVDEIFFQATFFLGAHQPHPF